MRFLLGLSAVLALVSGCGSATQATRATARSVDPSSLYVAQVRWSPSEITALGVVPAFPRGSWVALVAANDYVRHGRIGGVSRHECDDCIGPRMSIALSIDEPPTTPWAVGPSPERLPRIVLVSETPEAAAASSDTWAATSGFDVDGDGRADLERVERCGGVLPTGCGERACTRRCAATRTVGATAVRGELCVSLAVVPLPCVPPPPPPPPEPVVVAPPETVDAPEQVSEPPEAIDEPEVTRPASPETPRRRHWGSRRRPR